MSNVTLYPLFLSQWKRVIYGFNVVRVVPHLRRKHKVQQSTQRAWQRMEALQKQQRIFTISFPLYLNFLSLKIKTVKERVFLYYLLRLKYKRVNKVGRTLVSRWILFTVWIEKHDVNMLTITDYRCDVWEWNSFYLRIFCRPWPSAGHNPGVI